MVRVSQKGEPFFKCCVLEVSLGVISEVEKTPEFARTSPQTSVYQREGGRKRGEGVRGRERERVKGGRGR